MPTSGCAVNAGQDGAWWMAVNHVLLKEFHHDRQVPYFLDYLEEIQRCTVPGGVAEDGDGYRCRSIAAGRAAGGLPGRRKWRLEVPHVGPGPAASQNAHGKRRVPLGQEKGKWNLVLKDGLDQSDIDPR